MLESYKEDNKGSKICKDERVLGTGAGSGFRYFERSDNRNMGTGNRKHYSYYGNREPGTENYFQITVTGNREPKTFFKFW